MHEITGAPDLESVRANRVVLGESIRETPMIAYPVEAGESLPLQLWLKLEAMQVTGSFKARGALTVIRHLSAEQRARGLVTVSSGNHAIATAFGARQYGCSARIYMSAAADVYRIERARALGAEVHLTS